MVVTSGDLVVQASEQLKKLHVEADVAAPGGASIAVHLPSALPTRAALDVGTLTVDEQLASAEEVRQADGGELQLSMSGSRAGSEACELSVRAEGCRVELKQQSWLEMRLKAMEADGGLKKRQPSAMNRR